MITIGTTADTVLWVGTVLGVMGERDKVWPTPKTPDEIFGATARAG